MIFGIVSFFSVPHWGHNCLTLQSSRLSQTTYNKSTNMSNFSINGLLLILSFDLIRTHTGFFKNGIGVWILCFSYTSQCHRSL